MRISYWLDSNLNKKALRGNQVEVLPFLRVFLPYGTDLYVDKHWTVHFGWLFWTIGIQFYLHQSFSITCQEWNFLDRFRT